MRLEHWSENTSYVLAFFVIQLVHKRACSPRFRDQKQGKRPLILTEDLVKYVKEARHIFDSSQVIG